MFVQIQVCAHRCFYVCTCVPVYVCCLLEYYSMGLCDSILAARR